METRIHPLTGEPILFAPDRAARPRAFGDPSAARCPFCPGHESDTPPEFARVGEPWRVRAFPNRYPPIEGAEVVVESPRHEDTFDAIEHVEDAVHTYIDRYRAHDNAAYVSIFKNEGSRAGASIPHLHSQVVPLPFLPPRIQRESAGFVRAAACPLCTPHGHPIADTRFFTWLAPHASAMAYQQWIVPKRHVGEITELTADEICDLAGLLRSASAATRALSPSYNWIFLNFPGQRGAHCYIELFPRLSVIAGFELGTGTFVEIIDPAEAARRLRGPDAK